MEIVVYSAPGCCLCEEALAVLAPLQSELGFSVSVVDISRDPVLEARYRERIPVGEIEGRVVFKYRADLDRLRRVLAEASAAPPADAPVVASATPPVVASVDPEAQVSGARETPRFLADEMLGRLARWLRALGYDTAFAAGSADAAVLRLAEAEGRLLLTRDTRLVERRLVRRGAVSALLVRSDHLVPQLRQLREDMGLDQERPPRCMVCNGRLQPVSREEARSSVPPYVAGVHHDFRRCDGCGRIVWPGTHWERMTQVFLEAGFGGQRGEAGGRPG